MDDNQELIGQIVKTVTANVLKAVDDRIDERLAALDQADQAKTEKAKETIRQSFRK
ncbi:MAG: hypothetical protein LBU77_04395 [Clostridiales bacterium]|jgi:hypothetical protein|nr:hypothetical protein [Clostridiales bacterium]